MFTGLVQDLGVVRAVLPEGAAVHLHIETTLAGILEDGDSLATNGVCLTVTSTSGDTAVATAIPETLDRTNLGRLAPGSKVNLEPALRMGDRLGGHMVSGHVDGIGTLVRRVQRGISLELTFSTGEEILRHTVHKGSIAIDGVSLTVAALGEGEFTVALVPHTLGHTTLQDLTPGDRVNLESDLLAKYVERLLRRDGPDQGGSRLTEAWLKELGF
jgi:riboflavin synthase